MTELKYAKSERLWLKNNAQYNEKWGRRPSGSLVPLRQ